jgi:predicted N-formylglutamate amidohydrolase
MTAYQLLGADEPRAYTELNRSGRSSFVIAVDHASNAIPKRLRNLGLSAEALERHIAWDIGALEVATRVGTLLDAPLVVQNYSRLVIDCNRDPGVDTSVPQMSESTPIPGNIDISAEELTARRIEIFEPYHAAIQSLLDERLASNRAPILIAQHSMTNVFMGASRDMHAAILYNRDRRFAGQLLDALRAESGLQVADNQPYFVSDETDYTIPRHAEARGLLHVAIEIRQDLILTKAGQIEWAQRIAAALKKAQNTLDASSSRA